MIVYIRDSKIYILKGTYDGADDLSWYLTKLSCLLKFNLTILMIFLTLF